MLFDLFNSLNLVNNFFFLHFDGITVRISLDYMHTCIYIISDKSKKMMYVDDDDVFFFFDKNSFIFKWYILASLQHSNQYSQHFFHLFIISVYINGCWRQALFTN